MSMTDDQLAAIEARLNNERLPPAPWRWHSYSQYLDDDRGTLHAPCTPSIIAGDVDEVTGQFLAKAREDIPTLVAEVRRLREANAAYRNSWAMTSVFTKLDIFKAMGDNGAKAQSIIHEDMKLAWGLNGAESEGA